MTDPLRRCISLPAGMGSNCLPHRSRIARSQIQSLSVQHYLKLYSDRFCVCVSWNSLCPSPLHRLVRLAFASLLLGGSSKLEKLVREIPL